MSAQEESGRLHRLTQTNAGISLSGPDGWAVYSHHYRQPWTAEWSGTPVWGSPKHLWYAANIETYEDAQVAATSYMQEECGCAWWEFWADCCHQVRKWTTTWRPLDRSLYPTAAVRTAAQGHQTDFVGSNNHVLDAMRNGFGLGADHGIPANEPRAYTSAYDVYRAEWQYSCTGGTRAPCPTRDGRSSRRV